MKRIAILCLLVAGCATRTAPAVTLTPALTPPGVQASESLPTPSVAVVPSPAIERVAVFYVPHQDDETLSMGEVIADYRARGYRVEVVLLTDGAQGRGWVRLPVRLSAAQFTQARNRELLAALGRLGVGREHVHFADYPDGRLTIAEALATIRIYAKRFPGAVHLTMSETDRHSDHRRLGTALASLKVDARWIVFRPYWRSRTAAPAGCRFVSGYPSVLRAAREYRLWDPTHGRYAIGDAHLDPAYFAALRRDPRSLLCTVPHV